MNNSEHLVPDFTARGFRRLPPVLQRIGYGKHVRVYESSAASHPCVWLAIDDEHFAHLTVENARELAEQLRFLADNHYQASATEERTSE